MARATETAIPNDALQVLRECIITTEEPWQVRLPDEQLNRKLYEAVNETLTRIGGKWNRGAGAHVFAADPTDDMAQVCDTGAMPVKNPLAYFPTPPALAEQLAGRIKRHWPNLPVPDDAPQAVLEPSAGSGNLVRAIAAAIGPELHIDCLDIDRQWQEPLLQAMAHNPGEILCPADFLEYEPPAPYEGVIMNPPFSGPGNATLFVDHILHALGMTRSGGILVAVAPVSLQFRMDRKTRDLREHILAAGGMISEQPADTFRSSGTGVNTCIVQLVVP